MTKTWTRIIAAAEIVGGVAGLAFLSWELSQISADLPTLALAGVVFIIYALSLAAGVLLWFEHRWGRAASIVAQAIQLPKIACPAIIYNICFGLDAYPYLFVGKQSMGLGFELKLLAFYQLRLGAEVPGVGLGVSVASCVFLSRLLFRKTGPPQGEWPDVPPPPDPRQFEQGPDDPGRNEQA